jgi:hypothetical protein
MLQFPDITGLQVMLAPEQGQQIHDTLLARITALTADWALYAMNYSITDADVLNAMQVVSLANPASLSVFDESQFFGTYENPLVLAFCHAVPAAQWGIGPAPDGRDIVHNKTFAAINSKEGLGWVFTGSFNITASAQKECNNALIIDSHSMALFYAAETQSQLSRIQHNYPTQPPVARTADLLGAQFEGIESES